MFLYISVTKVWLNVVDAVKKKQLPAWIREGLNKMEREKQKKLERERLMQERLMRKQEPFEDDSPEKNLPIIANNPVYVSIIFVLPFKSLYCKM